MSGRITRINGLVRSFVLFVLVHMLLSNVCETMCVRYRDADRCLRDIGFLAVVLPAEPVLINGKGLHEEPFNSPELKY